MHFCEKTVIHIFFPASVFFFASLCLQHEKLKISCYLRVQVWAPLLQKRLEGLMICGGGVAKENTVGF